MKATYDSLSQQRFSIQIQAESFLRTPENLHALEGYCGQVLS